ncbi:MAG: hypothetical protein JWL84_4022 [Rhodospirillales bacterium]|jgi:hypothetical protein|nr:hypothetical protein [Rhodospirillales bacterium]
MSNAVVQSFAAYELDLQDAASVDLEIRRFVTGQTSGGSVLEALYGDIADEPIPDALLKIARG